MLQNARVRSQWGHNGELPTSNLPLSTLFNWVGSITWWKPKRHMSNKLPQLTKKWVCSTGIPLKRSKIMNQYPFLRLSGRSTTLARVTSLNWTTRRNWCTAVTGRSCQVVSSLLLYRLVCWSCPLSQNYSVGCLKVLLSCLSSNSEPKLSPRTTLPKV